MTQISISVHDAGDAGQRILQRQGELNLSIDELAERTGMAPDYLEYLENSPIAQPTPSALRRIALALEITLPDLLGGAQGRAQGGADAATDARLIKLEPGECHELLAQGGVGRLVFRSGDKPVALPVNFKLSNDDIVFRSGDGSEIAAVGLEAPVSFEVDRIDDAMSEGWSVLASGTVRPVCAADEVDQVRALGIEPWAGGDRQTYFRLSVTGLTGRRIVAAP